jgi:nucleotidyltransferase substrate binding protein (TIGR01987 family)
VERLTRRPAEARRALASFDELARRRERSTIERDAAIMRFAYTFEAAWKAVQLYLYEHEGLEVGSPKQSIRASRRMGLLTDEQAESALSMTDDRNLVVHVYREVVASRVFPPCPLQGTEPAMVAERAASPAGKFRVRMALDSASAAIG